MDESERLQTRLAVALAANASTIPAMEHRHLNALFQLDARSGRGRLTAI